MSAQPRDTPDPNDPAGAAAELPVLDLEVLAKLADELGSLQTTRQIVTTYLGLVGPRVQRILYTTTAGEWGTAEDVTLSLSVTSATVGALRMQAGCSAVMEHLGRRDETGARQAIDRLWEAAEDIAAAMVELLGESVLRTQQI